MSDQNFNNLSHLLSYNNRTDGLSINNICALSAILFTSCFGIIGNVLIVVCFQYVKQLKHLSTKTIIQSLGLQDILQNTIFDILTCFYILSGDGYVPESYLCKISSSIGAIVWPGGYWCVCGISLIRFCHCKGYSVFYIHRRHIIRFLTLLPWLIGISIALLGCADVLNLHYDRRLFACLQRGDEKILLVIIVYSVGIYLPLVVTAILTVLLNCYPGSIPLTKEQRYILRSVIVIFIFMLIFHCPFLIVLSVQQINLPQSVYPWLTVFGCLNSSINAIVFGWYSKSFRKSVRLIAMCKNFEEINKAVAPRCRLRYVSKQIKDEMLVATSATNS